jgi:hypothetical protein
MPTTLSGVVFDPTDTPTSRVEKDWGVDTDGIVDKDNTSNEDLSLNA